MDPDGNDDGTEFAAALPRQGRFVKVGRHFASLQRICDLRAFGGKLYAGHATQPLMFSGATVTRFDPATGKFDLLFDWNRPGQPEKGGGAGQGFLRIRNIDGRLYVPDGDPPYLGLGMTRFGVEGYVFTSDATGRFAPARRPGYLPPALSKDGSAGSVVLPGALHVFDVIRFRGRLYASTGAVLKDWTRSNASPATLFASTDSGVWEAVATHPDPPMRGAWRFRYLVRFKDRLYAAVTDFDAQDGVEYVVFEPAPGSRELGKGRPVQVTDGGAALTLRWFTDRGKLYWLVNSGVFVTDDGDHWRRIPLPVSAGHPADMARVGDDVVLLTERALFRVDPSGLHQIAVVDESMSPAKARNLTCAAPLAVLGGTLFAGGQRRGELFKLEAAPEP